MGSSYSRLLCTSLFFFMLRWSLFAMCSGSSAVQCNPREQSGSEQVCERQEKEAQILREVSQMKEDSVKQVIQEDETAHVEDYPEDRSAEDVWTAAFKQWIAGDESGSTNEMPRGAKRALEEARKRYGSQSKDDIPDDMSSISVDMPDIDNDELEQITVAVNTIGEGSSDIAELKDALDVIDTLCSSGDNGHQMEAVGGVAHLSRHARHEVRELAVIAIRALGSCSQNNPKVFESAVNTHGAVDLLLSVALESTGQFDLLAASLRTLVAVGNAREAPRSLIAKESDVVTITKSGLTANWHDSQGHRCVVRAYALAEQCLQANVTHWRPVFVNAGLVEMAENALPSESIDIREGAARVLALLR